MFSPCLGTRFRFRVCSVFGGTQSIFFLFFQYIPDTLSEKARKVPNHEIGSGWHGWEGGLR